MCEYFGFFIKLYCIDVMFSGVWFEFKFNVEFFWLKFIVEVVFSCFLDIKVKEELIFFCIV